MEIPLLLAAIVAFDVLIVALILIAWRFIGEAETEDTDFAERRLTRRSRSTRSARRIRTSRGRSHSRPLIAAQSRFDHPTLTLSTHRPS
jgi:hypothetical protein